MTNIQELLSKYREGNYNEQDREEKLPISERHELVKKFADKINANRIRDNMKPLQNAHLNKKMADAGLKSNFDLYWFYKYCDETKNFDKTWWFALNPKNATIKK